MPRRNKMLARFINKRKIVDSFISIGKIEGPLSKEAIETMYRIDLHNYQYMIYTNMFSRPNGMEVN